jgi:hypothetical protein
VAVESVGSIENADASFDPLDIISIIPPSIIKFFRLLVSMVTMILPGLMSMAISLRRLVVPFVLMKKERWTTPDEMLPSVDDILDDHISSEMFVIPESVIFSSIECRCSMFLFSLAMR